MAATSAASRVLSLSPLLCRPASPATPFTRLLPRRSSTAPVRSAPFDSRRASPLTRLAYSTSTSTSTSTSAPAPAPDTKFVYNVAASYIAKGRRFDPSTHVFQFNPYNRVQPPRAGRGKSSRPESGQDAFFVSRLGAVPGEIAVGVADGVGGWMDSGVDPADFSHAFCDYMAAAATAAAATMGGPGRPLTARRLMQLGYDAVCHDPAIRAGGSTAAVGLLTADGTLEVANLGDSGFILLRLNSVHAFSEPQTHAFNTPYQLSVVPPSMLLRAAAFGGAQLMDLPRDAEVTRHRLRHGDVLVLASDGLWDNLFNQDVLRIVSRAMARAGAWTSTDSGVQVAADLTPYTELPDDAGAAEAAKSGGAQATLQSTLATEIVAAAKAASVSTTRDGPFAKEVKKYYPNEVWRGGKEDDICAVVVLVSEEALPSKAKL